MAASLCMFAIAWTTGAIADGPEAGSPCTYLFDTGVTAANPLPAATVAAKKGWKVLAEDDTTHQFAGDAVLLNDRLVLVLRGKAAKAELYAEGPSGPVRRAAFLPMGAGGSAKLSAIRILENNPGAVMVEAGFQSEKGSARLTCRLTTGQTILELRPGEGVEKVRVEAPSRYVAVPDFFGDDMVFAASQSAGPRLRLPTENFFVHFVDPGGCLLMCVWPSNRQQAAAHVSGEGAQRIIEASEIECAAGKSLWIGLLEGPGFMARTTGLGRRLSARDGSRLEAAVSGQVAGESGWDAGDRPVVVFPRRGRRGRGHRGERRAVPMLPGGRAGIVPDPAHCRRHSLAWPGVALGLSDRPEPDYPADGFLPDRHPAGYLGRRAVPVHPSDRGPGLRRQSDARQRDDLCRKAVRQEKEKQSADEIRQMLAEMVGHVEHVDGRIQRYAALGRDVRTICQSQGAGGIAARAAEAFRPRSMPWIKELPERGPSPPRRLASWPTKSSG